jgi:hypothetical protein
VHSVAILITALGGQFLCTRLAGLRRFDPLSALISALSLCLLLRTVLDGSCMRTIPRWSSPLTKTQTTLGRREGSVKSS